MEILDGKKYWVICDIDNGSYLPQETGIHNYSVDKELLPSSQSPPKLYKTIVEAKYALAAYLGYRLVGYSNDYRLAAIMRKRRGRNIHVVPVHLKLCIN
jgi:hypothetical protein